jgi:hypothetical protein
MTPRLRKFVRYKIADEADVESVVNDVMVEAWAKRSSFRDYDYVRYFLYKMSLTLMTKLLVVQKKKRLDRRDFLEWGPLPSMTVTNDFEEKERVETILVGASGVSGWFRGQLEAILAGYEWEDLKRIAGYPDGKFEFEWFRGLRMLSIYMGLPTQTTRVIRKIPFYGNSSREAEMGIPVDKGVTAGAEISILTEGEMPLKTYFGGKA